MGDVDDPRSDRAGLGHRLRYLFDNLLARGTWAALVWLGVVTLIAVLCSAFLLAIFNVTFSGSNEDSWMEDFWQSLLRMLDTGTMAADVGWGRRILALVITIFGVLVAGTLIGIIANGVEDRIDLMRRGRSVVIESDHLVVLGLSERMPVVVNQLVLANAMRADSTIVVLSEGDPATLRDEVRRLTPNLLGTRLVFRCGDPTRRDDLALVRLASARAVIVLGGDHDGDARAVQSVLAVGAELGGFDDLTIVVEVNDVDTATSLVRGCGDQVHPLVPSQALARSAAFALREPGLSHVVDELMDFRGSDLHVTAQAEVVGMAFGEIVGRWANARPIGRMRRDGTVELNPSAATVIEPSDRLVLVADDLHALEASTRHREQGTAPSNHRVVVGGLGSEEHMVVLGWNQLGAHLLDQWAAATAPTSRAEVIVDADLVDPSTVGVAGLGDRLTVTPVRGAATLGDRSWATSPVTTVALLAYVPMLTAAQADSRTLLDLMLLRRELPVDGPRIIVEMQEVDNVELARTAGADDYIVSQAIGSQFLAQLAEDPARRPVLLALYADHGPSIHLVEAHELGLEGEVSFGEVVDRAHAQGLLAIAWRGGERHGDFLLNPHETVRLHPQPGDQVVVVG